MKVRLEYLTGGRWRLWQIAEAKKAEKLITNRINPVALCRIRPVKGKVTTK